MVTMQNLVYEKIPYFERRLTQISNALRELLLDKATLFTTMPGDVLQQIKDQSMAIRL